MKEKLRKALTTIATDIITSKDAMTLSELYETSKNLYEKIAVLKFIEEELNEIQIDVSKSIIADKFEKMANAVLNANTGVPESNPHQEDLIIPGMDTIKDMVSEMPSSENMAAVLNEFVGTSIPLKNDKELLMPTANTNNNISPKSLNDQFHTTGLKIGLNDKLAFVKHLFNNSTEDYNRVMSQLSTINTEERSLAFIVNMVKPDYNNWTDKEPFELRFMELIAQRFA